MSHPPQRPALAALLLLFTLVALVVQHRCGAEDFYLRDGERVVFFGDSITQNGRYVAYVETFLRTRMPEQRFEIINHGISSETISGTSEPDHDPRRPWAHERFARDVAAWRPQVLVSCFGMNDGNYHPPHAELMEKYQQGIHRLIRRTREEAAARLVILTPPPFDPYRRRASDAEATHYGYRFPAVDYDQTLASYSRWLLEEPARLADVTVVDLHGPMNEHLRRRRVGQVSYSFSPDAVHPNETGHWLMAQALLLAWNAPAEVDAVEIDAAAEAVRRGQVANLRTGDGSVSFTWTSRLPMPLDPKWDAASIRLERVAERLNRYRMHIAGLPSGTYRLASGDTPLGEATAKQLAAGLDLTALPSLPTNRKALEVLDLVLQRSQLIYREWRREIAEGGDGLGSIRLEEAQRLDEAIRAACRPTIIPIDIVRTSDDP